MCTMPVRSRERSYVGTGTVSPIAARFELLSWVMGSLGRWRQLLAEEPVRRRSPLVRSLRRQRVRGHPAVRGDQREVARDGPPRRDLRKRWVLLGADRLRIGAAGPERAAGWLVDRVRHVAGEEDP